MKKIISSKKTTIAIDRDLFEGVVSWFDRDGDLWVAIFDYENERIEAQTVKGNYTDDFESLDDFITTLEDRNYVPYYFETCLDFAKWVVKELG